MIKSNGFRRKRLWPNRGTILTFSCRVWWKPRKTSVRMSSNPAEIRTQHRPNANLKRQRYTSNFSVRLHQHLRGWRQHPKAISSIQRLRKSWSNWGNVKCATDICSGEVKQRGHKLRSGWKDNIKIVLKKYGVSYKLIRQAQDIG